MNLSGVSIHGHCFWVNGCQFKWLRWSKDWSQYPDWGPHPHTTKQPEWPCRYRGIWQHPLPFTVPVSGEETNTWLPWDLVLFGNMGDPYWRWGNDTTTPQHACQVPVVEDMVQDGKSGLTEAVVNGLSQTVLFYGWWLLGLRLGKAWDVSFMLSGAISWVGKQAQLSANPVSLGEVQ